MSVGWFGLSAANMQIYSLVHGQRPAWLGSKWDIIYIMRILLSASGPMTQVMELSFVRPTYWPPGMVRHCPYVCRTFMYHDAPSVIKSDPPFSSIDTHMNWNCDAPFHKMTHPMIWCTYISFLRDWTDLWRTHGTLTSNDVSESWTHKSWWDDF